MATLSYTDALRYLCGDPALRSDDDRRDEARKVVAGAVWALATEEGDGEGEMYDWVAEGDWSPADLGRLEAFSPEALAAEWDELQRSARASRAE